MFNRDKSGMVDIHEFEKLYSYINQWLAVFKTYDRDASGHIDESELTQGNLIPEISPALQFLIRIKFLQHLAKWVFGFPRISLNFW